MRAPDTAKSRVNARAASRPDLHRLRLSKELAWVLAIKLTALAVLWALFFSSGHRTPADTEAIGHHLGVPTVLASKENRRD